MGVRKFRSVEQMPGPEPRTPLDPENLKIAFDLMETTHRLAGLRRRPGVRKFRSWNELLLAREQDDRLVGKLPSRSELYDEIFESRTGAAADVDPEGQ